SVSCSRDEDSTTFYFNKFQNSRISFNKKVLRVEEKNNKVYIHCSDTTIYEGDVVVGADGAYSGVRQLLYRQLLYRQLNGQGLLPKDDLKPMSAEYACMVGVAEPQDPEKYLQLKAKRVQENASALLNVHDNQVGWTLGTQLSDAEAKALQFRNSEWGPESNEAMIKEFENEPCPWGGTMGNLIKATSRGNGCTCTRGHPRPHVVAKGKANRQGRRKAIAVNGDVTDLAFPERLVEETVKAFGKINIIVNNAGYTFDSMIHKTTDKQYQLMLDVHNISSTSGLHGNIGQANYATAKAGIVGLTKTIAKEWGPFGENGETIDVDGQKIPLGIPMGVKKEAPPPAVVFADTPLKRAGHVEEAAGSVLLLCSPFASYIAGHTLEVTGGKGI
ncbi:Methionine aminopeptidase 1, partial [Modicella reniformis]